MDNYQKIEVLLKNYRRIKSNIETELIKEYPEFALDTVSFIKVSVGKEYSGPSQQERYVLNKYDIGDALQNQIIVVNIINIAYESLPSELKKIVNYYYFEEKGIKEAARKINWSESTTRRRIEKSLEKLKKAGILKAWESWKRVKIL